VLVSRLVSVATIGVGSAALQKSLAKPAGVWPFVLGVAVLDSAAFAFYNAGVASGMTSVVSILSSLFSAVTVVLAFIFLRERMGRLQWAAVAVILLGVALVSSG
jgi:drug/metabolite transporter (DMT)-like permease